uniref:peptidoglycan-binding domain-containing protein n=1 Tax=Aquiflexum sp. TaxID=1872584 RepID=UPI0035930C68
QFAQLDMEDILEQEDFLPKKDAYEEEGFNTSEDSIDHFFLYENSYPDKDAYDEEVLDHSEGLMDHFHLFENSYTDKDAYEEEFFDSKILGSEIGFSFENPFVDGFSYENFERFNPEFNLKKAILRNRDFINKLHLTNYLTYINDFLLPYSELDNSSLGDEAFAEALSKWQQENGLEADGILGPKTWQKLRPKLNIPISIVETPPISPSISDAFEFNKWHASQILNIMNGGF